MTLPDPGGPPGSQGRAPPIVGLRREREVLTVALDTGRHGAVARERVAVLLSDCLPTAGGDPALALTGISRLHVLCPLPTTVAERAARTWPAAAAG